MADVHVGTDGVDCDCLGVRTDTEGLGRGIGGPVDDTEGVIAEFVTYTRWLRSSMAIRRGSSPVARVFAVAVIGSITATALRVLT